MEYSEEKRQFRIRSNGRSSEYGTKPSGSVKKHGISRQLNKY
jgi:hypothetical protein